MVRADYVTNPYEYLSKGNVQLLGLAEKKAEKKIIGMGADRRRLFAMNTEIGDITYYELKKDLLLNITQNCCVQEELQQKILAPGNENKITFKGFIPGNAIQKIQYDKSGKLAKKGPEINIHTNLNNRIYTLYFEFGEGHDSSAKQMIANIETIGVFRVDGQKTGQAELSQSGGKRRRTRKHGSKHKKRTHKKRSSKRRTRRQKRRAGRKLAKKSRKSRRRR